MVPGPVRWSSGTKITKICDGEKGRAGKAKKTQKPLDFRFFLLNCTENLLRQMAYTFYNQQQNQQSQDNQSGVVSVCV